MQRLTNQLQRVLGVAALTATTLTLQIGCAREHPTTSPDEIIVSENERRAAEMREMVMATDARLALLEQMGAEAMAIDVTADEGTLVLEGYVTNDVLRGMAEEVVARAAAPGAIENRLAVRPDRVPDSIWLEDAIADAKLEASIMRALMNQMGAPAVTIWVDANDRVVTLHGTVDDETQRRQALSIVQRAPGVVGIEDKLDTVL